MTIINYKRVKSTNLKAKELAKKGGRPWTILLAESQIGGYGRKGERWFSPRGGLYFSTILPKTTIEDVQILTILAAFVVARTIKENFQGIEPLIKLPNDVLIKGKKVAGILTENVVGQDVKLSVMGIGLNTNIDKFPKELKNQATSIKIELGRKVSNKKILNQILKLIKQHFQAIST